MSWVFVSSFRFLWAWGLGFYGGSDKGWERVETPAFNYDVFFLRNTNFPLTALVFRKVESRTTDKFKCIISQLMAETEALAKSIFEELGTVTLGENNLILSSVPLGTAICCSLGSFCTFLSPNNVKTIPRAWLSCLCYSGGLYFLLLFFSFLNPKYIQLDTHTWNTIFKSIHCFLDLPNIAFHYMNETTIALKSWIQTYGWPLILYSFETLLKLPSLLLLF